MNELTLTTPPPGVTAADYAAIEEAVMETARGRWFLLEYARRQRAAETQRLADAVDRLENVISGMTPAVVEPTPAPPPEPGSATAAAVADRLSDLVWTMRERGVGDQFCVELDKQIRIIRSLRVEMQVAREPDQTLLPAPEETSAPLKFPPPWRPQDADAGPPAKIRPDPDRRMAALSRLDALPLVEKIALFC